jgi:hypothetical protein
MAIEQAEFVVRTPEMTEFVHRWRRLPSDVRQALQRNRYSHVYQVVSRAVPKERSKNDIYLMGQKVPPADKRTVAYWEKTMLHVTPEADSDIRTTIGKPDGQSPQFPPETSPRPRRNKLMRKLLGKK